MNRVFFYDTRGSIVAHSITAPVFGVRAWERGYYPIETARSAAQLNSNVPADVLQSALDASMFGWDTPAARPARAWLEAQERAAGLADDAGNA